MEEGPQKTVVLDVVGLTRSLISKEHTPFLHRYIAQSDVLGRDVEPAFPAMTCPAQSTYLSGMGPSTHGITANVRDQIERNRVGGCHFYFGFSCVLCLFGTMQTHLSMTYEYVFRFSCTQQLYRLSRGQEIGTGILVVFPRSIFQFFIF